MSEPRHGEPPPGDRPFEPIAGDVASPGMGSSPRGPSFTPGAQPGWSSAQLPLTAGRELPRPDPDSFRPRRSKAPAVISIAAVAVVAIVIAVASLVAHRADQQASSSSPNGSRSPRVTATKDSIEFSTRTGAGRLTIVDHVWQSARGETAGEAIQVQVELLCTSGTVDYDPFDFQAFDQQGQLFDLAAEEARGPILPVGTLHAGESVRGLVAFVMPRGEVTLLMTDDASSVTALKIPD